MSNIQTLGKARHSHLTLLAISLATGSFGAIICAVIICLCIGMRFKVPARLDAGFLLVLIFCTSSVLLYEPEDVVQYPYMSIYWQIGLSLSLFLSYLLGYDCMRKGSIWSFLWVSVCLCVLYGVLSIVLALIYLPMPLNGLVFDLVHWRGGGSGSRASNFIALLPILLGAYKLSGVKLLRINIALMSVAIVCVLIGLLVDKRLYFATVFVVLPIVFVLLYLNFDYKKVFGILLMSMLTIFAVSSFFGLLERTYSEYNLNGGRFWLYESFFLQFLNDPFGKFHVPVSLVESPLWFHNIFMDISRISGVFPAFVLIILFSFYLCKIFVLAKTLPKKCNPLVLQLVSYMLIAFFSVVPEGEPQFILLLFLLFGAGEFLINNAKSLSPNEK